jgi:hypothetical protein
MNREERQLIELTAQCVLVQDRYLGDRAAGIETVLLALFVSHGSTERALARLQIQADQLEEKGEPSQFLNSFLERVKGAPETGSERREA